MVRSNLNTNEINYRPESFDYTQSPYRLIIFLDTQQAPDLRAYRLYQYTFQTH